MSQVVRVAVGLGSNCEPRLEFLRYGAARLRSILGAFRASGVYETQPLYEEDQSAFLNACCVGLTRLTPTQLLQQLQEAERAAGRTSTGRRYGPRTLDLDLLLYGERRVDAPLLTVPHERLRERAFVLVPLAEVAGEWIVPARHGAESPERVADLMRRVDRSGVVRSQHTLQAERVADELGEREISLVPPAPRGEGT